jgi:ABC-type multidrug transport system fused ATPase/permease subunit
MASAETPPAQLLEYAKAATDNYPTFGRLLGMLRPWWHLIALSLLLLILAGPAEIFPAQVWMFVVDEIAQGKDTMPWLKKLVSIGGGIDTRFELLFRTLVCLFVIYLLGETLQTIQQNMMNRVAQKFIFKLRNQVYHKLQSQSLGYLQRQRTGDLMSRAMGDVDEIQNFIVSGIDVIIGEGFLWLVTVAVVMHMDWRVATASLAPLVVVYVLLRVFNQRIKPIYSAVRERAGDVSNRLQENLSGVVVIKIFNRERQEAERFEQETRGYYDQQIKAINARYIYFPVARVVGFFSNIAMIGLGGYLILKGDRTFTLGMLIAFRAYWWRLFGPVQTLARVNDMVQRALAAARRVFEVLDAPDELPDAKDATTLERTTGTMELRNVSFRYHTEHAPTTSIASDNGQPAPKPGALPPVVLNNVSLRIESGKTTALCGPSGSGKSTLLNLLVRFYDPESGQVLLDDRDLRSIRRDSLRRHFALVQQETFLFNDSILDNIRYGHPDATMDEVIVAARAANAHAFISRLPKGYDTKVGERGVRLSGGQKQRISIARAFLANPSILLLDEPTSSVEPDSEAAIIAALDRLMAGRTTILTSHRPSLIMQSDHVYVIEGGQVTQSGRPQELADQPGWFRHFIGTAEAVETQG